MNLGVKFAINLVLNLTRTNLFLIFGLFLMNICLFHLQCLNLLEFFNLFVRELNILMHGWILYPTRLKFLKTRNYFCLFFFSLSSLRVLGEDAPSSLRIHK